MKQFPPTVKRALEVFLLNRIFNDCPQDIEEYIREILKLVESGEGFKMFEVQTRSRIGSISLFYIKIDSQEAADKLADEVAKKRNSFVLSVTETTSKESKS